MASFKLGLFLLAYASALLFHSSPAQCNDEEDSVLKGINSYRQTQTLPTLNQVNKATCLAKEVAYELEDVPCENVNQYYPSPGVGANPKIPNLKTHVDKCEININSTIDAVILPVCVAKLEPTIVLSNFTDSDLYAQYLKDPKYTGAGLGSEDNWMVLVLTTNTPTGSFSCATSLLANVAWIEFLLLAMILVLIHYLS